jgi:hypothetical protein
MEDAMVHNRMSHGPADHRRINVNEVPEVRY